MPTFRLDTKLGTMVPQLKTDDLNDKCVTNAKLADGAVTKAKMGEDVTSEISTAIANAEAATVKTEEAIAKAEQTSEEITKKTNEAIAKTEQAAKEAKEAQQDAEKQTMTMEDLQADIVSALEKLNTAITNASNATLKASEAASKADTATSNANAAAEKAGDAADNEKRITANESDIKKAKTDIEDLYTEMAERVDTITFSQTVTEVKELITAVEAKLADYCTLAKYTALKEQINTDMDALTKRVAALESK